MIYKIVLTQALLLVFLLCIHTALLAVSVNGNLTSAFWVRENRFESAENAETNLFLYEYLNLNAANIATPRLAINLSGRIGWDGENGFDKDESLRLYQGYLDWKLSNKSSLRFGRQFLPNYIGFWQMDGIKLETLRAGIISPSLYAGMAVPPWTIEGDRQPLLGVELNTKRLAGIKGKLGFLTILDNKGEGENSFGIEGLDKAIISIQFDRFGESILELLESPHNRLNVYGRGNFDVLSKQLINSYAFASVRILPKAHLSIGYEQEEQLFPADSIFSVFAVEPIQQLSFDADYQVLSLVNLRGQYARQFFDSDPVDKYGIGFAIGKQFEQILSIRLERLNDIDSHYWRIYSHVGKQFGQRFGLGFSNYYNNYRLSKTAQTEDAYSFQLKASYQLTNRTQILLRLEDNINPDYKYNIRALGYLRIGFGLGK